MERLGRRGVSEGTVELREALWLQSKNNERQYCISKTLSNNKQQSPDRNGKLGIGSRKLIIFMHASICDFGF